MAPSLLPRCSFRCEKIATWQRPAAWNTFPPHEGMDYYCDEHAKLVLIQDLAQLVWHLVEWQREAMGIAHWGWPWYDSPHSGLEQARRRYISALSRGAGTWENPHSTLVVEP